MKLLDFIPVKLTLFLIFGILIGYNFTISLWLATSLTCGLIFLLGISRTRKNILDNLPFGILSLLCTICIGLMAVALSLPENNTKYYANFRLPAEQYLHLKIHEILKSNSYNQRYIAKVIKIDSIPSNGRILLISKKDTLKHKFKVDDEIYTLSPIDEIGLPLNPYEFNYHNYLEKLGINYQVKVNSRDYFISQNASLTLLGLTAALRQKIISGLGKSNFGENELGIIQALLLGQRHELSEEVYTNYKNAGAVHILAVSGLHIGIVLLLCKFLLKPLERLPRGKTIVLIITVGILWGYAFIAGLSPSVIRAVSMFSFVAYALYLNRPTSTFNILALSMFFILLTYDPMLLFQVGFQLSYAAVFSIFWLFPKLQHFWNPENIILKKCWQLLSVSIAAQIGVLPLSLFYFHQFPGLFFISNLMIIPFLGLILGMGFLVIALMLTDLLPNKLSEIYNRVIRMMNELIEWVAQQESFIFIDIPFDFVQLVVSYILIFTVVQSLKEKKFQNVLAVVLSVIAIQLWLISSTIIKSREQKIIIFHKTGTSALLYKNGISAEVNCSDTTAVTNLIKNLVVQEKIQKVEYKTLKNSYRIKDYSLLILNNSEMIFHKLPKTDYVLLSNSPKVNFNRFLDSIKPKKIIADGSNYRSDIERWQKSCSDRKLPFYYTGEKGAFILEIK
ncbi:ComEC/Rec2 family competence protein [uncultured Eudoraea sp.]|uniref:ComEC/Rec2 family competence protein n=1 Tax=uncultured Eudoraea sp. TaxID=1035614 RepID=UPI0026067708|nr:ComEC/Rec2 family competence protein [uncultured Eudoraea sp.]